MKKNKSGVSWWDYAAAYDYLCEVNYHYEDLLNHFSGWLSEQYPEQRANAPLEACDLGAGTGNFVLRLVDAIPQASITHWDWNSEMVERAKAKYSEKSLQIDIVAKDAQEFSKHTGNFDIIVMINALYTFPNPEQLVRSCAEKLNKGGHLYIVDAGRTIDTMGWVIDLTSSIAKKSGVLEAVKTVWRLRKAIRQNKKIEAEGDIGTFWRHDLSDLVSLVESEGLKVSLQETCYRDIADRVIATKI